MASRTICRKRLGARWRRFWSASGPCGGKPSTRRGEKTCCAPLCRDDVRRMSDISKNGPLNIGSIIFPQMDQCDFTGPFEVLSQVPGSTFHVLWKEKAPIRDRRGFFLTPEKNFSEGPLLGVVGVSGGAWQQGPLVGGAGPSFIRNPAPEARY